MFDLVVIRWISWFNFENCLSERIRNRLLMGKQCSQVSYFSSPAFTAPFFDPRV
jgi:hypothetical protein